MKGDLEALIERFISGGDVSITAANAIESGLDDALPHDDNVQQTVEMLTMYRPDGGDFLFDTSQIREALVKTMVYVRKYHI